MKLHLPTSLRSALFACFSAACALTTTLFSGSLAACLIVSSQSYASYNAATDTFEGTNNSGINPTASTYNGVETLIFNMGAAGTGNYLNQASWTYDGNIQIGAAGATETGLCLNNGYSNQTDIFSGKVTGTGLLSKTGAGRGLTVAFTGDVSDFSGGIRLGSTAAFTLRFGNGSAPVSSATAEHGVAGTGDITFCGTDLDTLVYHYVSDSPVYITNRLLTTAGTTSKVQLDGAAPYVLTKDATVSQLTLGEGAALHIGTEGKRAEVLLGALTMGAGASVYVDNGVLSLQDAASLGGSFAVGTRGVLHLSHTAAVNGSLEVEAGGSISLGALSGFTTADGVTTTPAAGTNGFAVVNGKLSVLTGSAEQLQTLSGTKVLYAQQELELAADGTVTLNEVDRSVYYLRHGQISLSALKAESNHELSSVEVSAGAELNVDTGAVQGRFRFGSACSVSAAGLATTITGYTHAENLSATQGLIVGNGATLSIGSTVENNVSDINIRANGHLVFESDSPTQMRVGAINNNHDGVDNYARTIWVGEGVSLRAAALINSWGLKSLTVNGKLNIDGVLQYSTGGNAEGTNLLTGSGTITAGSLNISNYSNSNTIDVHELTVTGDTTISRSTTISGGTTALLGNTAISQQFSLTGGHLILGDALSDTVELSQAAFNLYGGKLTLNGTTTTNTFLTQTGGSMINNGALTVTEGGTLYASSAWENSAGSITFLSGSSLILSENTDAFEHVNNYSEGDNGFYLSTSAVVFRGGTIEGADVVNVSVGDTASSLSADGTVLLSSAPDYTTYYLNSGSKSLADMQSGEGAALRTICMGAGASLVADTGDVQGVVSVAQACDLSVGAEGLDRINRADVHFEQLSATAELVAYIGATMTIGSTAENNASNIYVTQRAHLIFESEQPTAMSVGNIYFQGCDDFERTMDVEEGVTLHAASVVNSWGLKALTVNGTLNIDGVLQYSSGGNTEGTNLITGTGSITAGSLNITNWSNYNTIEVQSLRVTGDTAISCNTILNGGTTELLGNVTTWGAGQLTVNGGHLILGDERSDEIAAGAAVNLVGGEITLNGSSLTLGNNLHQTGGTLTINGGLRLSQTLTASGTVNLNGMLLSSADALTSSGVSYTDGQNGFRQTDSIVLRKGDGELIFNLGDGAIFLLNGADCASSLTADASGNIVTRYVDDSTYYLNSGSKSLTDILNASTGALNGIIMADGTELAADTGNLQGLFSVPAAQRLLVGSNGLSSVLTGNVHIEHLAVTGNLIADNNATLSIGSTAADNTGDLSITANAHLNFESDTPAEMQVGTIRFERGGDNYERTMLVGEGVALQADSVINSWGMKSLTVNGELNIDGALQLVTSDNPEDSNVVTGSGTITAGSLEISNNGTSNTINVHELRVTGDADISRPLTISGGTTGVSGNTNVTAELNIAGGHLVLGDEQSDTSQLNGNVNLSAGELTINGTARLGSNINQTGGSLNLNGTLLLNSGGHLTVTHLTAAKDSELVLCSADLNVTGNSTLASVSISGNSAITVQEGSILSLQQTIVNNGILSLSGTINADALELEHVISTNGFINTAGESDTSGFVAPTDIYRVSVAEGSGTVNGAGAIITHTALPSDVTLTMSNNGIAINGIDYSTYYLHGDSAELSAILAASPTATVQMTGGCLTIDVDTNTAIEHDNAASLRFTMRQTGTKEYAQYAKLAYDGISSDSYGGAIYSSGSNFTLSGNGEVTFSGNTVSSSSSYSYGGAIYNYGSNASFTLSGNGVVTFSGNTVSAAYSSDGGAIYSSGSNFTLSGNGEVTFSGNTASSSYYSDGGAIYSSGSNFTLSGNGEVTFSGNTASGSSSSSGGAIYSHSNFTLSDNETVTFSGNTASGSSSSSSSSGGAISNYSNGTFTLSDNGAVTFSGNTVSSSSSSSGGAISNSGNFTLSGNGEVTFSENTASNGGAIANNGGIFTLRDNGVVTFSGNTASNGGGAIYSHSNFTLSDNETVTFSGNTASGSSSSSSGGAIYNYSNGTFTLSDNGAVTFSGNTVSSYYSSYGGAISNSGNFTLSGNGEVTFSENTASNGGAISSSGTFTLSDNGEVTFSGNTASNGGAIYSGSNFTLSGNGEVTFSGNTASNGGAIFNKGTFTLKDNGNVVFEKNAEINDGGYRLLSIYSTGALNLSAKEGKSILFKDSVYVKGAVSLNLDGSGDIIFSGATTAADLREIKGAEGTLEEVRNSQVSWFYGDVALSGGSLQVQDGANLFVFNAFTIGSTEQAASLALHNGCVSSFQPLRLSAGASLMLAGSNYLLGSGLIAAGSNALSFSLGEENLQHAALTITGPIQHGGNLALELGDVTSLTGSNYRILHVLGNSSGWDNVDIRITGATSDDLSWVDGCLYYRYNASLLQPTPPRIDRTETQRIPADSLENLVGYRHLSFEGQTSGINGNNARTIIMDNESVTFSGNTASSSSSSVYGGAICNSGSNAICTLLANMDVSFSKNSLYREVGGALYGGAIYNSDDAAFSLGGNGDVTFSENVIGSDNPDFTLLSSIKLYGGAIYNSATLAMGGNKSVTFSRNRASALNYEGYMGFSSNTVAYGGAIYNEHDGSFSMNNNRAVTFMGNSALSSEGKARGGAIYNLGIVELVNNEDVIFCENSASCLDYYIYGGAICNDLLRTSSSVVAGRLIMSDNGNITFCGNRISGIMHVRGGAIYNHSTFTMSGNGDVTFSGNCVSGSSDVNGGAIFNEGTFTLSGNGDVTFSGNTASLEGGAIYNERTFTLSGNGDVLFEKNAEVYKKGTYRLRSIYSRYTLNLASLEGKSIIVRDSLYSNGTVNLNQDYTDSEGVVHKSTGDIILTGATTEADLREVKGGVDGTAQEILNSRTSEIATNVKLYGGRLIVEDGAILKGGGITFTEGANATLRLNGGTLNETGYTIAVSSGSGLEFEGENTLAAASVSLADNSFLSFILDEAQTAVHWDADLDIQGGLSLHLTHEDKPVHDSYALLAMQSGNSVTGWDATNLVISGTTAEHLVWENNTLYYLPMLVQENGDTTLDKDVDTEAAGGTIGGKEGVSINGNGHTLNVKNEVQMEQMAFKNGTVKLEGANNGIDSVSLTEGGELVLAAGAELKTGDIISMVASSNSELVISGDITLDSKGLTGKAGAQATVSCADAQVLGDATISNVHVEDSVIDLAEGSTVGFEHVVLAATTRITDDPATANLDDVTAELVLGVNTSLTGSDMLLAGTTLAQSGNTGVTLTLSADASVLMLEATTFDSLTLSGSTLVLELAGMTLEMFDNAELIAVSFTSGTDYATFGPSLAVTLTFDGVSYETGYTIAGEDGPTTMYFRSGMEICPTPEPATATLSLLALAALAARRKRKG